jgi:hypothetical protein
MKFYVITFDWRVPVIFAIPLSDFVIAMFHAFKEPKKEIDFLRG